MPGILPERKTIVVHGKRFEVHGRIPELDVYVILGADSLPGQTYKRPGSDYELVRELGRKHTIFRAYCKERVFWLSDLDAASGLIRWLADRAAFAPGFDYQVAGEVSEAPILDCFVGAANFIENLGLDVRDTIGGMTFTRDDPDALFFEALAIFWPAFEKHLGEQRPRVMMFNRMFSMFGEASPMNLRTITDSTLRSMSHLMIDEFQDISPQIVSWVRATLTEIRRRGKALHEDRKAKYSSLLCVGDDWQSIYGWRGSAPKYFMEFESEFKSPANTPVMLRENFRSHQFIIDSAEHIVRSALAIPGKKAKASGPAADNPVAVEVLDRDDARLAELVAQRYSAGDAIMVLFRRRADGDDAIKALAGLIQIDSRLPKKKRRIKLMTYHRSKGLEADSVFLLGDCVYMTSSPYKDQAYLAAGLGAQRDAAPYDSSQKDELLRLAYVAITRAIRHCYWFIDVAAGNDARPKASDHIARNQPYFVDRRKR